VAKESEQEGEAKKKKGPRGGIKHGKPGRGHARKSSEIKKRQFRRKAEKKRKEQKESLEKAWQDWDALPPDAQKLLRRKLMPTQPRPTDED